MSFDLNLVSLRLIFLQNVLFEYLWTLYDLFSAKSMFQKKRLKWGVSVLFEYISALICFFRFCLAYVCGFVLRMPVGFIIVFVILANRCVVGAEVPAVTLVNDALSWRAIESVHLGDSCSSGWVAISGEQRADAEILSCVHLLVGLVLVIMDWALLVILLFIALPLLLPI